MRYVATVLVCLAGQPCDQESAVDVFKVPGLANGLAFCMMRGQAYAAQSGRVGEGEVVKVRCRPAWRGDPGDKQEGGAR